MRAQLNTSPLERGSLSPHISPYLPVSPLERESCQMEGLRLAGSDAELVRKNTWSASRAETRAATPPNLGSDRVRSGVVSSGGSASAKPSAPRRARLARKSGAARSVAATAAACGARGSGLRREGGRGWERWERWGERRLRCARVSRHGRVSAIDVSDVSHACGVRVVCVWCACGVRVVCVWCACRVRVVCVWCVAACAALPSVIPLATSAWASSESRTRHGTCSQLRV